MFFCFSHSALVPPLHFPRTPKWCIPPFSICVAFTLPGPLYLCKGCHRSGYCTSNATPFVVDLHLLLCQVWPSADLTKHIQPGIYGHTRHNSFLSVYPIWQRKVSQQTRNFLELSQPLYPFLQNVQDRPWECVTLFFPSPLQCPLPQRERR